MLSSESNYIVYTTPICLALYLKRDGYVTFRAIDLSMHARNWYCCHVHNDVCFGLIIILFHYVALVQRLVCVISIQ